MRHDQRAAAPGLRLKVAIIGFGVEGKAAYEYWKKQGAEITICDQDQQVRLPEEAAAELGGGYLEGLNRFDLIVRSPGTKPAELKTSKPVTSVTNEFLAKCPAKIIGVTGTKGKGTTSSLIAKILEAAGKTVWLGGNIGKPALEFLDQVKPEDYVVLELSSFQLMDVRQSPQIAVMLMIVPEHLNWHQDMDEYTLAKGNLFRYQQEGDLAVYNAQNRYAKQLADLSIGRRLPYMDDPGARVKTGFIWIEGQQIMPVSEVGLIGPHNQENVCAAVAATWGIVGSAEPIRQAVREFRGLPHRLEFVRELKGVKYYDDSFATTPETAIAALKSFNQPKVVILGGSDKGAGFGELAKTVKQSDVRQAIVIGDTADRITKELNAIGYDLVTSGLTTMPEIVREASKHAKSGDIVLLSTGCASFGLFENYKDRAEQFQAAVKSL